MDFFSQSDLDKIQEYAGQDIDDAKFSELKSVYEKLKHLCTLLESKGYEYSIRVDPRKQAGRGMFKFQEYQWARIFPKGMKEHCDEVFSYIIGLSDTLYFTMMGLKGYQDAPSSISASQSAWEDVEIENSNFENVVNEFIKFDSKHRRKFIETGATLGIEECIKINTQYKMESNILLLKHKNQIILQGPPGTGKTRLAKLMAENLAKTNIVNEIQASDIQNIIKPGLEISTTSGYNTFAIISNDGRTIKVKPKDAKNDYSVSYKEIFDCFENNTIDNAVSTVNTNGNGSYIIGISKFIRTEKAKIYFKIIQFHPAYSYEDFVRGIVAESNGNNLEYKTQNKVLAEFALLANKNYINSKKKPDQLSKDLWIEENFKKFKQDIEARIDSATKIILTTNVYLSSVETDCFRYTGDNWAKESRINFKDFRALIEYNLNIDSKDPEIPESISTHGFYRSSYYGVLLKMFFEKSGKYSPKAEIIEPLKNYILIIDEINRANLPSVLGELIYALEYRGEAIDSVYSIDGDRSLTLPPNLYIIGTMNSADRSVGHIDYAIRRRFAFVDILPTDSAIDDVVKEPALNKKAKELYKRIEELFYERSDANDQTPVYLAPDFKAKDVQLGHSYFLVKSQEELEMKLQFEIKPILREYLRDGLLLSNAEVKIESLSV